MRVLHGLCSKIIKWLLIGLGVIAGIIFLVIQWMASNGLSRAEFSRVKFDEVQFTSANLSNANFSSAKLYHVDFFGANLTRTKLPPTERLEEMGVVAASTEEDES